MIAKEIETVCVNCGRMVSWCTEHCAMCQYPKCRSCNAPSAYKLIAPPEPEKFDEVDRWLYSCTRLRKDYQPNENMERTQDIDNAVLISSEVKDNEGMHAPAIDIDMPCKLVESSTPGHYHLFIDKILTAEEYDILLSVMAAVGIVEQGFHDMFLREGRTLLRVRDKKHDPKPRRRVRR